MFMINYELVYGKSSKIFHKPNINCDCTYKENQAEEPECISSEQNIHKNASLKNAVSAVSGFAANAGAILKSEETAPKLNSLKGKAGAVVSGLGSSLTGLKKKASDLTENISTSVEQIKNSKDNNENHNFHEKSDETEYCDSICQSATAERKVFHQQNIDTLVTANNVGYVSDITPSTSERDEVYMAMLRSVEQSKKIKKIAFRIAILVLIIGLISLLWLAGVMVITKLKEKNGGHDNAYSTIMPATENTTVTTDITVTASATVTTITTVTKTEETSVDKSSLKTVMYKAYFNMASGEGDLSGDYSRPHKCYLYDINKDGLEEMINLFSIDAKCICYSSYSSGNLSNYYFGNFLSADTFELYEVTGDDGSKYLYYTNDFENKSSQGYFNPTTQENYGIFIEYDKTNSGDNGMEYFIYYSNPTNKDYIRDNKIGEGGMLVEYYGEIPDVLHKEFMLGLINHGFNIDDNSTYSKLDSLTYNELCVKLGYEPDKESEREETNNENAVNVTYNVHDYPQYVNRLQKIYMLSAMESDYVKFTENDLSQTYSYGDIYSIGYLLQDLNSDGTPELITVTGEMSNGASSIAEVYSILDDELILLCRSTDKVWYSLCENNIISCTVKMGAGPPAVDYLEYSGGNTLIIVSHSAESIKADCEPLSELEFISLQSFLGFGFVKTDEGGLNLRTEPSTSSNILYEIPKGDIIFIYEDISGWYNVMHNEIFGYVSKEFVDAYFFN